VDAAPAAAAAVEVRFINVGKLVAAVSRPGSANAVIANTDHAIVVHQASGTTVARRATATAVNISLGDVTARGGDIEHLVKAECGELVLLLEFASHYRGSRGVAGHGAKAVSTTCYGLAIAVLAASFAACAFGAKPTAAINGGLEVVHHIVEARGVESGGSGGHIETRVVVVYIERNRIARVSV